MVRGLLSTALAAATLAGTAYAGAKCSKDSHCPSDTPCCSLYGDCGVGAFCLGGCDPLMSHSFDSCVPGPVCKSGTYALDTLSNVQSIDKYLGDSSKIDWQSQGMPAIYTDPSSGKKSTLLTMAQGTVGTLMASTHYVWYGKICAKATTAQGKGVVTAFILMSDVKDEIDFEWIGVDTGHVQSNFYSQGVTVYTNGKNLTVAGGNTVQNMHEYCIDWKEDTLTWSIDGDDTRTLNRKDTWNGTSGRFDYPQTPARIMLSLWPAGLPTNEKGTVDWAGGEIDWNSPYMQNGYYYARFQEVTVDCYDPPSGIKSSGSKSYKYTDASGTNNTVQITNDQVILGSLMGTGENPGEAPKSGDAKPTATDVANVPGGNVGGGNRAEETATQASASGTGSGAQATGDAGTVGGGSTEFSQGGSAQQSTGAGASIEPRLGGSILAVAGAVFGLAALL
ncbi:putative glycosidase CRH2 [Ascochyta clinopodiicola]|nr:putative glycosidase CRH2 [Ascochyta clinopodiicola]